MCEPVTATTALASIGGGSAAMGGATLASSGLSILASKSAIDDQNRAAAANRANAVQAQNDQNASTTKKYIEENRSLLQGSFDSVLAGRAAEADAYTSAIANGASGNSVKALMGSKKQVESRNAARAQQEMSSLRGQTGANFDNIRSQAQGRINQTPTTSFGIADAAKALTPIVRGHME